MAASSVMTFFRMLSSQRGMNSSVRNTATAIPNNDASATPMVELTIVPTISGKIPNCPLPASQCFETTNPNPYLRMAGMACFVIKITTSAATTAVKPAKMRVTHLKDRSTACSRAVGGRAILSRCSVGGPMDGVLASRCGCESLKLRPQSGDHRGGHPDVAKLLSNLLLAIFQAAEQECLQRFRFAPVVIVPAAQDPGVSDDRVGFTRLRVRNLDLEVLGNLRVFEGLLARLAVLVGQDEPMRLVLERRHGKARELRVTVFDVSDRAGRQLDQSSHAVIALGRDRLFPWHGLVDAGRPLDVQRLRDCRHVRGKRVGGAAAVGARDDGDVLVG